MLKEQKSGTTVVLIYLKRLKKKHSGDMLLKRLVWLRSVEGLIFTKKQKKGTLELLTYLAQLRYGFGIIAFKRQK